MRLFEREAAGIYRLRVPFENLTTSVFLLVTPEGPVLYDCATTSEDVETVILPALAERRIAPQDLRAVVLSHAHADHNGGLAALREHTPDVPVITAHTAAEAEVLFGCLQALHLPGHTADCLGVYDLRTGTLLTADALQLMGVARFGCSLAAPEDYVQTIEKIRRLAPDRILPAHAYVPYGDRAEGTAEITRYLDGCLDVLAEIKAFVAEHQHWAAEEITDAFRAQHPHWPQLPKSTVKSMQKDK